MKARYEVRFTNGYYKAFDNEVYTDVALHYLKTDAEKHVEFLNNKGGKQ